MATRLGLAGLDIRNTHWRCYCLGRLTTGSNHPQIIGPKDIDLLRAIDCQLCRSLAPAYRNPNGSCSETALELTSRAVGSCVCVSGYNRNETPSTRATVALMVLAE